MAANQVNEPGAQPDPDAPEERDQQPDEQQQTTGQNQQQDFRCGQCEIQMINLHSGSHGNHSLEMAM